MNPNKMRTKVHKLKTWSKPFFAVTRGLKKFEVRKNDRDFKVGDVLVLKEYNPMAKEYTGETYSCTVIYILKGGQFGIEEGYVIMTII